MSTKSTRPLSWCLSEQVGVGLLFSCQFTAPDNEVWTLHHSGQRPDVHFSPDGAVHHVVATHAMWKLVGPSNADEFSKVISPEDGFSFPSGHKWGTPFIFTNPSTLQRETEKD